MNIMVLMLKMLWGIVIRILMMRLMEIQRHIGMLIKVYENVLYVI